METENHPGYDCTSLPLEAYCVLAGEERQHWMETCIDEVEWTQPRYYHQN